MDRRNFLKSAACLAAFPSSLLACDNVVKTEFNKRQLLKDLERCLRWSTTPDEWGIPNCTNTVSKGPYSVVFGSLKDLCDCHSICATAELAAVVVTQLQYSKEDIKTIWGIPWENVKEREQAWKDLRRIEITEKQVNEIYSVFKLLRGSHNCVPYPDYWLKAGRYA